MRDESERLLRAAGLLKEAARYERLREEAMLRDHAKMIQDGLDDENWDEGSGGTMVPVIPSPQPYSPSGGMSLPIPRNNFLVDL